MDSPIKIRDLFKLTDVGISQEFITDNNVSMQSDRAIVCRGKIEDYEISNVILVDTPHNRENPFSMKFLIAHPSRNIIAYNVASILMVHDLDNRNIVKSHKIEDEVVYLKWISDKTIGLVTETNVYHWNMDENSGPKYVFKRNSELSKCRITNYEALPSHFVLSGQSTETKQTIGWMQLYDRERRCTQPKQADAVCFASLHAEGNRHPSNVLATSRQNGHGAKLIISEVGRSPIGNKAFPQLSVDVPYAPGFADDFPIFMQAEDGKSLLTLVTKRGFVHIFDIVSSTMIHSERISEEKMLAAVKCMRGGMIGLDCKGRVFSFEIDDQRMIEIVVKSRRERKLSQKCDLPRLVTENEQEADGDKREEIVEKEEEQGPKKEGANKERVLLSEDIVPTEPSNVPVLSSTVISESRPTLPSCQTNSRPSSPPTPIKFRQSSTSPPRPLPILQEYSPAHVSKTDGLHANDRVHILEKELADLKGLYRELEKKYNRALRLLQIIDQEEREEDSQKSQNKENACQLLGTSAG